MPYVLSDVIDMVNNWPHALPRRVLEISDRWGRGDFTLGDIAEFLNRMGKYPSYSQENAKLLGHIAMDLGWLDNPNSWDVIQGLVVGGRACLKDLDRNGEGAKDGRVYGRMTEVWKKNLKEHPAIRLQAMLDEIPIGHPYRCHNTVMILRQEAKKHQIARAYHDENRPKTRIDLLLNT